MFGAARAQGAELDIPNVQDAKDHFDTWLRSVPEGAPAGDILIKRALGLKEG